MGISSPTLTILLRSFSRVAWRIFGYAQLEMDVCLVIVFVIVLSCPEAAGALHDLVTSLEVVTVQYTCRKLLSADKTHLALRP